MGRGIKKTGGGASEEQSHFPSPAKLNSSSSHAHNPTQKHTLAHKNQINKNQLWAGGNDTRATHRDWLFYSRPSGADEKGRGEDGEARGQRFRPARIVPEGRLIGWPSTDRVRHQPARRRPCQGHFRVLVGSKYRPGSGLASLREEITHSGSLGYLAVTWARRCRHSPWPRFGRPSPEQGRKTPDEASGCQPN